MPCPAVIPYIMALAQIDQSQRLATNPNYSSSESNSDRSCPNTASSATTAPCIRYVMAVVAVIPPTVVSLTGAFLTERVAPLHEPRPR